jgi:peptidoglycan hydrolase CwlO-like protein
VSISPIRGYKFLGRPGADSECKHFSSLPGSLSSYFLLAWVTPSDQSTDNCLTILLLTIQTREDIIASREKRKLQLEGVLEQINQKVADYHAGKKDLAQHQLEHMEHKIKVYQHQIEEFDRELDEDVSPLCS